MLRHDLAHVMLETVFANHVSDKEMEANSALTIDIDDCDCSNCNKIRGPLQKYSTMSISFHREKDVVTQRLTPKEARRLAKYLTDFADIIDDVSEFTENQMSDFV